MRGVAAQKLSGPELFPSLNEEPVRAVCTMALWVKHDEVP
jgi:hypothetical protein